MSDPIIASLIGAAVGVLSLVISQFAVVRAHHVRVQQAAMLDRQLSQAHAPLDFYLAALADLSTPQSDKADIQRKLRDILRDSGHLLSPALRASIHGLLWCTDPANRAAETFARFRPEYDRMVNQFRAAHFALPFVGRRPYRADAAVPLLRKGKHLL